MKTCTGNCDQGRNCNCDIYNDSGMNAEYIILIALAILLGALLGAFL